MIYGSVCSGIEAATVAWEPLGWKPSFFSEIEKFPRAVLKYHYPDVPLHGDFTTIKGDDYEPIDLLVGGTPCQSFSVAGLRKGLDDERGNLALEYLKLAKRLGSRWLVWENVPGVLSSWTGDEPPSDLEQGQTWESTEISDFGCFLAGLEEFGYRFAYRVFDAQYFGVPQRRRRVFVVGYFGDWRPPAAVLFERHSLCGNSTPGRKKREETTGDTGKGSFFRYQNEQSGIVEDDITATVRRESSTTDERSVPAYVIHGTQDPSVSDKAFALGQNNGQENVVLPIHDKATRHKGGGCRQEDGVERNDGAGNGLGIGQTNDPCFKITSNDKHAVCYENHPQDSRVKECGNLSPSLNARAGTGGNNIPLIQKIPTTQVRRLTPIECERLQGFPDNYTRISWHCKNPENCPDGPRYKALGNSMAVPVMHWIAKRIQLVEKILTK